MGTIVKPIKKPKTEFKVAIGRYPEELETEVKGLIEQGWKVNGGMNVVTIHEQKRYRGSQHIDTIFKQIYSISMIKN